MMGLAPTKQTTDLRKGLSDRAIYWIDVPRVGGWRTLWKPDDSRDVYCYFDENHLGDTELVVSHLTPAQVLAATTVVRCRDCKHCRKSFDGRGVVCVLRSLHHFYTDPDGYCSNGKLRDLPSTGSAGGQARGLYQSDEIERLQAENAKLKEDLADSEGYDQMLRDRLRQQTELHVKAESENAKLRKLVVRMRPICVEGKRCTFADRIYINTTMEELGIGVGE